MQTRRIATLVRVVAVLTLLLSTSSTVAGPSVEEGQDSSKIMLAGTVASKISYQGRLTDVGGNPLSGNYNLVFQFWDDAAAGSQVGSDIVRNNTPMSSGLFTVDLDVPHDIFNGQALWLRIQVNGQWLSPRQELLPVPYALSVRPGAWIKGNSNDAIASVVNTTDDADDGACNASHCSLREAIQAANANPGPDAVAFDIPASDPGYNPSGWWTIRPASELPDLTDDGTTIDGVTQTANRGDTNPLGPEIELDGQLAGEDGRGIDIRSSNNLVRGLVINRFGQDGLRITSRNVSGNRVVGNYIGTDARGQASLGNRTGLSLDSGPHDNFIGGEGPGDGNLISGNREWGLSIYRADSNQVIGNHVGTDAVGIGALGNGWAGVSIQGGSKGNVIGPTNHIAYNLGHGIRVEQSGTTGNTITQNAITSNDNLGVLLSDGGNNELESPVITAASATQVSGTACSNCTIEIFSDAEDEGAIYEGTATADASGNWTFTRPEGLTGPNITATATDAGGNTSEFSVPVSVAPTPTPTATPTSTVSPTPSQRVFLPIVLKSYH